MSPEILKCQDVVKVVHRNLLLSLHGPYTARCTVYCVVLRVHGFRADKCTGVALSTRPIFLDRHIYRLRYVCVFYSYPVPPPQFPTAAIRTEHTTPWYGLSPIGFFSDVVVVVTICVMPPSVDY